MFLRCTQRVRDGKLHRYWSIVENRRNAQKMVDVCLPTTDGRLLILPRYTQPEPDQQLLLQRLRSVLPPQPAPRISQKTSGMPLGDNPL
jgi:hypothetical protein